MVLRLYLREDVGVAFCCLLLRPGAVSHWRAGVCAAFAGFFFQCSLCAANTHLSCACLHALLREMGTLFPFLLLVVFGGAFGAYRVGQAEFLG